MDEDNSVELEQPMGFFSITNEYGEVTSCTYSMLDTSVPSIVRALKNFLLYAGFDAQVINEYIKNKGE